MQKKCTEKVRMKMDKKVNSIKEVDLSGLEFPVVAVYKNPLDYPDKVVARIFEMNKPTDTVIVKERLEEIQKDIKENTGLIFVERGADDVKSLVGVWV